MFGKGVFTVYFNLDTTPETIGLVLQVHTIIRIAQETKREIRALS